MFLGALFVLVLTACLISSTSSFSTMSYVLLSRSLRLSLSSSPLDLRFRMLSSATSPSADPINVAGHKMKEEVVLLKDQKVAICRCWQSKKFPFCDGAHARYNINLADDKKIGPMIVSAPKAEQTV